MDATPHKGLESEYHNERSHIYKALQSSYEHKTHNTCMRRGEGWPFHKGIHQICHDVAEGFGMHV